jgi:mono/diheme cytochrome c family protein
MPHRIISFAFSGCLVLPFACWALAGGVEKTAVDRGGENVHRPFNAALFSHEAYDRAWRQWGLASRPADYDRKFRERYGLFEAPYANQGMPMGFHEASGLLSKGLGNDCLLCHAGSIAGQTVIGLGNASLDLESLYQELTAADGYNVSRLMPLTFSNVRGTIEAGAVVMYLLQFRDAELNLRPPLSLAYRNDLCEDIPAWWNLKKKKTMYHTGATDARSVHSLMAFLLSPFNTGDYIKRQEPAFADIRAYLLSLEPPKYPFPVDQKLAERGHTVFTNTCSRCHGTYGPDGKYPSRVVPLDVIGTDPLLVHGVSPESGAYFLKSWLARESGPDDKPLEVKYTGGYQAPPLDGIWATPPYLHNGSVPTVYHLLNSKTRPKIFTRSYRTGRDDYDPVKLGWKIQMLDGPADASLPGIERRKIYDTTQPGRGNPGHTFGDKLTEDERLAVIEYLKTL